MKAVQLYILSSLDLNGCITATFYKINPAKPLSFVPAAHALFSDYTWLILPIIFNQLSVNSLLLLFLGWHVLFMYSLYSITVFFTGLQGSNLCFLWFYGYHRPANLPVFSGILPDFDPTPGIPDSVLKSRIFMRDSRPPPRRACSV